MQCASKSRLMAQEVPSSGVRERFAMEVEACRSRQAQTKLIVMVDADVQTVRHRIQQLDQALQQAAIPLIDHAADGIARLVPKRNIETWILCLNEELINEETDYKRTRNDWSPLIRPAIDTLFLWTRPNAVFPRSCVESLQIGIRELQNLGL